MSGFFFFFLYFQFSQNYPLYHLLEADWNVMNENIKWPLMFSFPLQDVYFILHHSAIRWLDL